MKIVVRGNDVMKAYKILKRKLDAEGVFREMRDHRFYRSKSQKRIEKHKYAVARRRKEQAKREKDFERDERNAIIDSKKRAKQYKQQQRQRQQKK